MVSFMGGLLCLAKKCGIAHLFEEIFPSLEETCNLGTALWKLYTALLFEYSGIGLLY